MAKSATVLIVAFAGVITAPACAALHHARHAYHTRNKNESVVDFLNRLYATNMNASFATHSLYEMEFYEDMLYVHKRLESLPLAPPCVHDTVKDVQNTEYLWGLFIPRANTSAPIASSSWAADILYRLYGNTTCVQLVATPDRIQRAVRLPRFTRVLTLTRWMPSWGHQLDSLTTLADVFYRHKFNELGFKVLFDLQALPWSNKTAAIAETLFGDNFFNPDAVDVGESGLLAFEDVALVRHVAGYPSFHSFPAPILRALQHAWDDGNPGDTGNVFLTRSTFNEYRILKNHGEVENFFRHRGVRIVNPETMTNREIFNNVKDAANLIVTAGSALSNLIHVDPSKTRVFCLRSAGYQPPWRSHANSTDDFPPESERIDFELSLWANFIDRFDFRYVESWNNIISEEQLADVVASFKM